MGKFGYNNPYDKSKDSIVTSWLCIEDTGHAYEHDLYVEGLHAQSEQFKLSIHAPICALHTNHTNCITEYFETTKEGVVSILKSDAKDNLWDIYRTLTRLTQAQCLK